MIYLQKRIAEILGTVPEIAGTDIFLEDKSDLVGRILTEIGKSTALCIAVSSARGNEADSAAGIGMFNETIRVSFFASVLADNPKAILPIVEAAIKTLHEAPVNPNDAGTDPVFRVTGHEEGSGSETTESHAIIVEALWTFQSRN